MSERAHSGDCACGCCAGVDRGAPATIDNRPGLPAVAVRAGTAASFLASMQGSAAGKPALTGLRTRLISDPTVALMDAWSVVLDVLTFYSERIANEGYLPTATEGSSLVALARAVGYERGPGRAAQGLLAFAIDEGGTLPPTVALPGGTQIASSPGPGEVPQTFETSTALDAAPAWNAMPARLSERHGPSVGDTAIHLPGTVTAVRPGDVLLFVDPAATAPTTVGSWTTRQVTDVTVLPTYGVTRVGWSAPLVALLPSTEVATVHVLRQRASLFGYNATDWNALADETRKHYTDAADAAEQLTKASGGKLQQQGHFDGKIIVTTPLATKYSDWPGFPDVTPAAKTLDLDADYPNLVAGSWLIAQAGGQTLLFRVASVRPEGQAAFGLSGKTTRVVLDRDPAALEGHRRSALILTQSEQLELGGLPISTPVTGDTIELADDPPPVPPGRTVIVTGQAPRLRVTEGTFGLALVRHGGGTRSLHPGDVLTVTGPFEAHANGTSTWPVAIAADAGSLVASAAQVEVLPAGDDQPELVEVAQVAQPISGITPVPGVLRLTGKLANCFERTSLRVLANVVDATHGVSKHEVLGNGDAAATFQRFTLAQTPLTYAPASGATGVASTLTIAVDDLRWHEIGSLDDAGPGDRVYVVRMADDGKVTVQFGDGVHGARLPTGEQNIVADYRVGIGMVGRIDAGRLSLPLDRPLGLRSVANPLPTGLAADPDAPEALRSATPSATLLVDRVVSVTDYADFARQRPGIAKAAARVLPRGATDVVHVTVAADAGQPIDAEACADLESAAMAAGDGSLTVAVDPAEPISFDTGVTVFVDPDRVAGTVRTAVIAALLIAFGFDARALAQPVNASEVMAAAQAVPGVVAVTVRTLFATGASAELCPVLASLPARSDRTAITPAQLLLIRPEGLDVVEAT